MRKVFFLFMIILSTHANSDIDREWSRIEKIHGDIRQYPRIVNYLINSKLYFSSLPLVKEYLFHASSVKSKKMDLIIDKIAKAVGVRQFEVLPIKVLQKSRAVSLRYISAKKLFRRKSYKTAYNILKNYIPNDHFFKPFSLFLESSILTIQKKNKQAIGSYKRCVDVTRYQMKNEKNKYRLKALSINRDYCLSGIARSYFANRQFEKANLAYLDLPKKSFIWPELLFEEAWTSFYQKDYNRTLGKLVTYKSPVLSFIFNPEIEILKSLAYFELCLWGDVNVTVNNFYERYEDNLMVLKSFLRERGNDYKGYFELMSSYEKGISSGNRLIDRMLVSILRDTAYTDIKTGLRKGVSEIRFIKSLKNKKAKSFLLNNLRHSLLLQKAIVGGYIRQRLRSYYVTIKKSLEGMSYIKLEMLDREEANIYGNEQLSDRSRGNIKYLKRNEKQYFWIFNGEFWADELGDYVFALRSQCSKK